MKAKFVSAVAIVLAISITSVQAQIVRKAHS